MERMPPLFFIHRDLSQGNCHRCPNIAAADFRRLALMVFPGFLTGACPVYNQARFHGPVRAQHGHPESCQGSQMLPRKCAALPSFFHSLFAGECAPGAASLSRRERVGVREANPVRGVWNRPHPSPLPKGEGTTGLSVAEPGAYSGEPNDGDRSWTKSQNISAATQPH